MTKNKTAKNMGLQQGTEKWKRPEEGLPGFGEPILVAWRSKYKGRWVSVMSVETRHPWNDEEADRFRSKKDEVIAWMPIPDLPEDLKKYM